MSLSQHQKLNKNHLQLIAIIAMTVDHIADLLYPNFQLTAPSCIMHIVGRLTAPIMFFFVCEGFFSTKNLKKYLIRMFLFAAISHFAYCFAFGINFLPFANGSFFNQTSVMWSLAWAVVALWVQYKSTFNKWIKALLLILICVITFPADWSSIAVMAIVFMYGHRGNLTLQMLWMEAWVFIYAVVSFFFVNKVYGIICLCAILVWPLLLLYNGQKGKANWMKWLFYIYYPAHLLIVGIIRFFVLGNIPLL